jgi:hypothetical protein
MANFSPYYYPHGWGLTTVYDLVFAIYVTPLRPTSKPTARRVSTGTSALRP